MSDNTSPYGINPFPKTVDPMLGQWGVGACTVANSPVDLGQEMIKRRIQNKSWKEIADEFGMPNPSAARAKFQKLTGITDFKIKGKELKSLVDNDMLSTIKGAAVKKAKKAVAAVDDALDVHKAIDVIDPKTKKLLDNYGITKSEYDNIVKDIYDALDDSSFETHGKALLDVYNKYNKVDSKFKFKLINEIADDLPAKVIGAKTKEALEAEYKALLQKLGLDPDQANSAYQEAKFLMNNGKIGDALEKHLDLIAEELVIDTSDLKKLIKLKQDGIAAPFAPPVPKKGAQQIVAQFKKNNEEWMANSLKEISDVVDLVGPEKYDQAMKMINGGEQLYSKIKTATGLDFKTIDQIYWNNIVAQQKGNIWDAYKLKPTSETGFNAIKEMVFDLRASGFTVDEIISVTGGIDKKVIELIMKGEWKVPAPGSTTIFTGGPTYTPYSSPASVSQTPVVIYETPVQTSYDYMTEAQYKKWHDELEHLTSEQMQAFKSYTGSGYSNLNASLRGGATGGEKARHLSEGMRPLVSDTRVTRYVSGDAFPGNIKDLGGTVYTDKGFMSTAVVEGGTFGRGRSVKMIMDLPAGTPSRYVDTFSSNSGEKELLLDKNLSFMVTKVVQVGNHWNVYMKALV